MKKVLTSIILTISLTALIGYSNIDKSTADNKPAHTVTMAKAEAATSQAAPDFNFTDLATGTTMKLSDLRGKPVYLNLWATWCPPCVRELPHIQAKYEQYKDRIHFLAISIDNEQEAPLSFLKSKGYSFPAGFGNPREISSLYRVEAIPVSYIIDANGIIKAKKLGSMDAATLESFLKNAE